MLWTSQRVCRVEALSIAFSSFLLGTIVAYFTLSYYGDGCLEPQYHWIYRQLPAVIWTESVKPGVPSPTTLEVPPPPTIFAITPTYARLTQRVDLTTICHTLMHIPDITWIVIEDSENTTELVTNLLAKCKSVNTVHLTAETPPTKAKGFKAPRGVPQRNAGLNWIRTNCSNATVKCRGVVYFMDDDNKYDLTLFEEIRKTKRVSVFPVAFAGGLKVEGPICFENGTTASWHVSFGTERSIPIDMAGFAINIDLILANKKAAMGIDEAGKMQRRLEDTFLKQFTTKETAECLGGQEIMVWHVRTRTDTKYEEKNPSDPRYIV